MASLFSVGKIDPNPTFGYNTGMSKIIDFKAKLLERRPFANVPDDALLDCAYSVRDPNFIKMVEELSYREKLKTRLKKAVK